MARFADLFRHRIVSGPARSDAERAELAARIRFERMTDAELLALPDAEFAQLGAACGFNDAPALADVRADDGAELADVREVA